MRICDLIAQYCFEKLTVEKEFVVIEKTGLESETEALLDDLRQYGIYQFVRSGRVAIAKPMEQLSIYLDEMAASQLN